MNVVELPAVTAHGLITGSYIVRDCPYCKEKHPHILNDDELKNFNGKVGIYRNAPCKNGAYIITELK